MKEQYKFSSTRTGRLAKVFLDPNGQHLVLVGRMNPDDSCTVIHRRTYADSLAARMHAQHAVTGVTRI